MADLDIKYRLKYDRIPKALVGRGAQSVLSTAARDVISMRYLDEFSENMPVGLYLDETVADSYVRDYDDEITGCVRFISSLSCVDGLVLATPDLGIRGFGVEIRTKKEVPVVHLAPGPTASPKSLRAVDPNHYGTRHRSMMRYCFAHPRSTGFVISQDGEIRAITRVKTRLVMWENLRVLQFFDDTFKKQAPKGKKEK
jgi:hypothetical protein